MSKKLLATVEKRRAGYYIACENPDDKYADYRMMYAFFTKKGAKARMRKDFGLQRKHITFVDL